VKRSKSTKPTKKLYSSVKELLDREKIFINIAGCRINLELDFNTPTWGIEYNGIQLVK
jgi:hypothetical protein